MNGLRPARGGHERGIAKGTSRSANSKGVAGGDGTF